jgi:prephenate dehydrogenase
MEQARRTEVAIIGGSGKMGQWFSHQLRDDGHQVIITGRDQRKLQAVADQIGVATAASNAVAVKQTRIVIISVPIDRFEEVVREIAPHTRPEQFIFDVTSVKTMPVAKMHQYITSGLVLGTHPVFGPGAGSIANHSFVLTPTNEAESSLAEKARDYLVSRGGNVSLMTPEQHDELMAVVLGLSHFISIASADTLARLDRLKELKAIGGVTYQVLLTLIESVISEDPALYASIQMSLPAMPKMEGIFLRCSQEWSELVKNSDRAEFMKRMSALKSYFEQNDSDFGQSYQNVYRIVEGK